MQEDLFIGSLEPDSPASIDHNLGNGLLREIPRFYSPQQAQTLFERLMAEIPWRQERISMAGRDIPVPRLQCWMGDPDSDYGYSGLTLQPQTWTATVLGIRDEVAAVSACEFNSVLLNLYRDGSDSVSWHADDEPELGRNPVIASLSLGAARQFQLRPKDRSDAARVRLELQSGGLLIMSNTIQNNWLHQVPKTTRDIGPRINLTFRLVKTRP